MDIALNVVIGLAVAVVIAGLQLRTRELTARRARVAVVLTVVGVAVLVAAAAQDPPSSLGLAAVAAGLAVGAALGVARARSTDLWSADGRWWSRGTRVTAALWAVGIGVHLALDLLVRVADPVEVPFSSASTLLFVGLTLATEALVQHRRVALRAV